MGEEEHIRKVFAPSDDELAHSMFVYMERHGERMVKATAAACAQMAERARDRHDHVARDGWEEASVLIEQAATRLGLH